MLQMYEKNMKATLFLQKELSEKIGSSLLPTFRNTADDDRPLPCRDA